MLSAKCSSLDNCSPHSGEGFYLHKQEFQDALRLRYGWEVARVPSHCVYGVSFSMDHAIICRHDGLTFICHNELRNLTASWLHEVCHSVAAEPPLQPLTGKALALDLLITEMMLGKISMPEGFGIEDRVHF